jgi:hypothetical protein
MVSPMYYIFLEASIVKMAPFYVAGMLSIEVGKPFFKDKLQVWQLVREVGEYGC